MNLFTSQEFNSLQDLLLDQLRDLYDAEKRLTEALPKMAEAAHSAELQRAFRDHLQETQTQVSRLDKVFAQLGEDSKRETCQAMKGLLQEGDQMVKAKGDPAVIDAGLIAAAQRVEHYEMAGYGTARAFAEQLGHSEIASLLQTSLEEESDANERLTQIAEQSINVRAAGGSRGSDVRSRM